MTRAPIALTCGEPASIAPEITAQAWIALRQAASCAFFLIGDANDFLARTAAAGLPVPVTSIQSPREAAAVFAQALPVMHVPFPARSRPGFIDTSNSPYVMEVIRLAAALCLEGAASAMVTNPINKDALYAVGFPHQGHTDFLAAIAREAGHDVSEVMMLVAQDLRAIPVTIHVPLKDVPELLTAELITTQADIVAGSLQRFFGIHHPRLAITGLNPHAGENGAMGDEEKSIIMPAVRALRAKGMSVTDPLSADTAFHAEARATYDAILCMYHDQALIPVKTLDFHGGVNATLGLPFIRTSPDHGTALGIAGKGIARADSLISAIALAEQMVINQASALMPSSSLANTDE